MSAHLVDCRLATDDNEPDSFAHCFVDVADDDHLPYTGQRCADLFDLVRIDVFAAADDRLAEPAEDGEPAAVDPSAVAGAKPPVLRHHSTRDVRVVVPDEKF